MRPLRKFLAQQPKIIALPQAHKARRAHAFDDGDLRALLGKLQGAPAVEYGVGGGGVANTRTLMRSPAEATKGRALIVCGQTGVSTKQSSPGETIGPPAESE